MPNPCTTPVPAPCAPSGLAPRILDNFTRRYNTAHAEASLPTQPHPTNGDENLPDFCGSYSKCIQQSSPGKVNVAAFKAFRDALQLPSGNFAAINALTLASTRTLNGPAASYASQFVGSDSSHFGAPSVPAPPSVDSLLYATELVELYWCSLLRDVPFSEYASNPTAIAAAAELNTLSTYQGPKRAGTVVPPFLFRGNFAGETIGPYVSQLLLTGTNFGAADFSQRYTTYVPNLDYMTELYDWYQVQQGSPFVKPVNAPQTSYLRDGRGLAAWTHVDELYQAYFTAYLVLAGLKVPPNPMSPYTGATAKVQNPFGTFGGPDIAAVLAQVAKAALNACWYQKWVVHLRHRPEAGGGLVHLIQTGAAAFAATPNTIIFNSQALAASHAKYGTYLLSQAFPEGSPSHPAYPTGHGAVGGACITILKFFYDGTYKFANPVMPSDDGQTLLPYTPNPNIGDPGDLTLNGELHKLAHNITFGHGLHGGIHWRTDSDASMQLGEAVALKFLDDLACSYAEPFNISITLLDGSTRHIKNT